MSVDNTGGTQAIDAECGVLYIATNEKFVQQAFRSAETLKRVSDVHCTLITDAEYEHDLIDNIVVEENPADRPDNAYKAYNIHKSPYDRTIYLDADTYMRTDISGLFDILDDFELAVTHAPVRNTGRINSIPEWFPEYNCGVMVYDTAETEEFFQHWRDNYEELEFVQDQPSFRKTLFESDDISFFTLLREYNVRFWPGYVDEQVKILHTQWDNEAISEAFGETSGPRAYHYYDKELVIQSNRDPLLKQVRDSIEEDGVNQTIQKAIRRIRERI